MSMQLRAIKAAVELAKSKDYKLVTRQEIADYIGASPSVITWYFRNMDRFRSDLIRYCYDYEIHHVLGRAALDGAPELDGLDKNRIRRAKNALLESEGS